MYRFLTSGLGVFLILALGIWLRIMPLLISDFPINDGGMFYSMTEQILVEEGRLPNTIKYNNLNLPFAYPPLGFYTTAVAKLFSGTELINLFRIVPVIWLTISLPIFYLVTREYFGDRLRPTLAVIIYALTPAGYYTIQAGGGITRGLGLVMALLALLFFLKFRKNLKNTNLVMTGVFTGLCVISHMEMTVFLAFGLVLLSWKDKMKFNWLLRIGFVVLLVSSPWWITILARYGWQPFLAAWGSNMDVAYGWQKLVTLDFTFEPVSNIWAIVIMMGCLYLVWSKNFLLPLWLGVIFVVLRRGPETTVMIPAALIGAEFLAVAFKATIVKRESLMFTCLTLVWLIFYLVGLMIPNELRPNIWMETVSYADLRAFDWVKQNSTSDSKFLIVTGNPGGFWASNSVSEWFPALTGRESVITIQGTEWKYGEAIKRFWRAEMIYQCMRQDYKCAEKLYAPELDLDFDYLYFTANEACPGPICVDMKRYDDYSVKQFEKVYSDGGVNVWKRI